jgi:hypothetical protein
VKKRVLGARMFFHKRVVSAVANVEAMIDRFYPTLSLPCVRHVTCARETRATARRRFTLLYAS